MNDFEVKFDFYIENIQEHEDRKLENYALQSILRISRPIIVYKLEWIKVSIKFSFDFMYMIWILIVLVVSL